MFSGAIHHIEGEPEEGEVVRVVTADRQFIAIGHYQIGSIAVRVLSFVDEPIDEVFWHRRLAIAYDMRRAAVTQSPASSVKPVLIPDALL